MFIEQPANKMSLAKRGLTYGFGVNDSDYLTSYIVKNKELRCPYYTAWCNMLKRCYYEPFLVKNPTYLGCSVCDEWLIFSNFKSWVKAQSWEGKHLDKDILVQGNKIYSPELCIFVPTAINVLFVDRRSNRGKYPSGVTKIRGKYRSRCRSNGKYEYLGLFDTPEQAFDKYKIFKLNVIKEAAMNQPEPLRSAMLNYKIEPYPKMS